jgi:hypothetical protein
MVRNPILLRLAIAGKSITQQTAATAAVEQRRLTRKIQSENGFLRTTETGYDMGANNDPDGLLSGVTGTLRPKLDAQLRAEMARQRRSDAAKRAWVARRGAK